MTESRRRFFDQIAPEWDARIDHARTAATLSEGLREIGLAVHACVLDLGCGTGNLTLALTRHLGPEGRVFAVDLSALMLEQARRKVRDPRVTWLVGDAEALPVDDAATDEVICFSAWPHFPRPERVVRELCRVLRAGGAVTVWHALPRARINAIHEQAGPAIQHDHLLPGVELARLFAAGGLEPLLTIDDSQRYLVRARRRSR